MAVSRLVHHLGDRAALQDPAEVAAVSQAVETTVEALARGVAQRDSRFECDVIPSGSFYEGTKIVRADEFDYMLCLRSLSVGSTLNREGQGPTELGTEDIELYKTSYESTTPHVFLRIVKPELQELWKDCLVDNPTAATISKNLFGEDIGMVLLNGGDLKAKFYHHMKAVLSDLQHDRLTWLSSSLGILEKLTGAEGGEMRGVPETLDFAWDGDKSKRISVDVCLTLHVNRWSRLSDVDRRYGTSHPHSDIIGEAVGQGFHVVPKFQYFWRLSWSRAEASLLSNIFKTAPSARLIYKAAKFVNENHFLDKYNTPSRICDSYALKSVLFHTWFDTTEEDWGDVGTIFLKYLQKLHDCFRDGNLPHFFVTSHNLLPRTNRSDSKAAALRQCMEQLKTADVDSFLQNPVVIKPTKEEEESSKSLRSRKIRVVPSGRLKPPESLKMGNLLKELHREEIEESRKEEGAVGESNFGALEKDDSAMARDKEVESNFDDSITNIVETVRKKGQSDKANL